MRKGVRNNSRLSNTSGGLNRARKVQLEPNQRSLVSNKKIEIAEREARQYYRPKMTEMVEEENQEIREAQSFRWAESQPQVELRVSNKPRKVPRTHFRDKKFNMLDHMKISRLPPPLRIKHEDPKNTMRCRYCKKFSSCISEATYHQSNCHFLQQKETHQFIVDLDAPSPSSRTVLKQGKLVYVRFMILLFRDKVTSQVYTYFKCQDCSYAGINQKFLIDHQEKHCFGSKHAQEREAQIQNEEGEMREAPYIVKMKLIPPPENVQALEAQVVQIPEAAIESRNKESISYIVNQQEFAYPLPRSFEIQSLPVQPHGLFQKPVTEDPRFLMPLIWLESEPYLPNVEISPIPHNQAREEDDNELSLSESIMNGDVQSNQVLLEQDCQFSQSPNRPHFEEDFVLKNNKQIEKIIKKEVKQEQAQPLPSKLILEEARPQEPKQAESKLGAVFTAFFGKIFGKRR